VLTIGIPVRDEADTIGVLLWRVRTLFQEYAREYEVLVYDDGSRDATAETLAPYAKVMPLAILGGGTPVGYARALDALLREAARRTRYPRRDALVLMQADFTDLPEHLPDLVKRFEGGADLVVGERAPASAMPAAERRLRRVAPWLLRPFARVDGVRDLCASYRLIRLQTVRDALKAAGDRPLVSRDGWAGDAELLVALAPHARRIDAVPLTARYDLRPRASRRRAWPDGIALLKAAPALKARTAHS
jgi:glycosyltransferase involved in cell wall biosynthesis